MNDTVMNDSSCGRDGMALEARNISKHVDIADGNLTILENIQLDIPQGQTVAIVGASGSGKSTLLALLAGLDLPSTGNIFMHGQQLTAMDEDGRAQLRSQLVGFVFQAFQLLPALNALENVMLPLELAGHDDCRNRAGELLHAVGLGHRLGHYPNQLSGGEQQRVAVARAFVTTPRILFADEPTGNLDRRTGQHIIDLLFRLNAEQGTTLVLVTHDEELAANCQRRLYVDTGKLVRDES